jgi:hypothetical protein
MIQEQIELLERQYNYLSRQKGVNFIRQARCFCSFLQKNAHYSVLLQDMISETQLAVNELEELDGSLMLELVAIRTELQQRAPEYDDSNMKPPTREELTTKYESSFAFFDAHLKDEDRKRGIPMFPTPYDDRTKFNTLRGVIAGKVYGLINGYSPATGTIEEGNERKDLEDLRVRLEELQQMHNHKFRSFLDAKFTLPGVSWINLETTFNEINPEPTEYARQDPERMLERALHGYGRVLRKALYEPEERSSNEDKQSLSEIEKRISEHCERVYEELRLRLGTTRSNLALIRRYKNRCEWHDRERLFAIAQTKSAENDLTAELARYLFDQGLNPLTRARTADLEPDLLDPTSLGKVYVEAKQYSKSARDYLVKGVGQVHDTLGRLRGTPYEVTEAFLVIFRRGGPRYIFPNVINSEGYEIYIILIDIAPTSISGTRQKHRPIQIPLSELVA